MSTRGVICQRDAKEMNSTVEAIFFECERPELADTKLERRTREQRIQYFLNRGALTISKVYDQPTLGPDRRAVPPWLRAYPVSPTPDWALWYPCFIA